MRAAACGAMRCSALLCAQSTVTASPIVSRSNSSFDELPLRSVRSLDRQLSISDPSAGPVQYGNQKPQSQSDQSASLRIVSMRRVPVRALDHRRHCTCGQGARCWFLARTRTRASPSESLAMRNKLFAAAALAGMTEEARLQARPRRVVHADTVRSLAVVVTGFGHFAAPTSASATTSPKASPTTNWGGFLTESLWDRSS